MLYAFDDFSKEVQIYFEHNLEIDGSTYMVIFGRHINGGFICIPNHSIGCEATDYFNGINYNSEKLEKAGIQIDVATDIATHIEEWLQQNRHIITSN